MNTWDSPSSCGYSLGQVCPGSTDGKAKKTLSIGVTPSPDLRLNAPVLSSQDPLGEALDIREVAHLLGCSSWTVRHRYLRKGLPYFRMAPLGKLIFYRNQVIRWLLEKQQQKGDV